MRAWIDLRGITARLGLGKIRHMHTHYLWLQERVRNKDLNTVKVKGDINPADVATKHLASKDLHKMMDLLNYRFADGRAESCPELSHLVIKAKARKHKRPF